VQFHLLVVLNHFVQNFFNLAFLSLELAKFLVEVVNEPDSGLVEFISIFILSITSNHRHIEMLYSK